MLEKTRKTFKQILIIIIGLLLFLYPFFENTLPLFIMSVLVSYLLISNPEEDIYLYALMIPFNLVTVLFKLNLLFILLWISIIKMLFIYKKKKIDNRLLFISLMIISLEFFNDFLRISYGDFLHIISILIYFLTLSIYKKHISINTRKLHLYLLFGSLLVLSTIIIKETFQGVFLQQRLGTGSEKLGGAMSVPIYALFSSIFLLQISLLKRKINYSLLFLIIILISIGLMSRSRVFLIGLGSIGIYFVYEIFRYSRFGKKIVLIVPLLLLLTFIFRVQIIELFDALLARNNVEDISSGRFDIYKSVVVFQLNNLRSFFLGSGIINYPNIGIQNNYLFYMLAHNIYLDIWISLGLFGGFALASMLFINSNIKNINNKFFVFLPAITLGFMYLTAGTLTYFYTFIYFVVYIYFPYSVEIFNNDITIDKEGYNDKK